MSGSSNDILAGVSPGQIRVLLELLHDSTWRSREFVEVRYRERARNFLKTLNFLQRLGWVRVEGTEIRVVDERIDHAIAQNSVSSAVVFLEALLDSPGEHGLLFARYLARFQGMDGDVSCPARGGPALADAPVRDFLMELGAVRHDPAKGAYFIEPAFFGGYVWALSLNGPQTSAEMMDNIEDRQWLGRGAELAVVSFERERLGSRWAERVQHVADKHPAAPYDIKSVTVTRERAVPRYVEVKAVSPLDFAFHWSAGEIEAARLLRTNFYLYLVPVRGSAEFDFSRLQIIADPFVQVYSHPAVWDKQPTHFLCRPAMPSTL
jgi:hypothetical protein